MPFTPTLHEETSSPALRQIATFQIDLFCITRIAATAGAPRAHNGSARGY
jgi:hypothetical protein